MDCNKFDYNSSLYIDGMLSDNERKEFEKHIEECSDCAMALKNLQTIVGCLNDIDEIELPSDFNTTLRQKLTSIEVPKEAPIKKTFSRATRHWKGLAAGLVILVLSVAAYNGMNFPEQTKTAQEDLAYESAPASPQESFDFNTASKDNVRTLEPTVTGLDLKNAPSYTIGIANEETVEEARLFGEADAVDSSMKLIHQGRLRIETSDFDDVYGEVIRTVDQYGGYLQHSEIYYRKIFRDKPEDSIRVASLSIRIPGNDFMEVFENLRGLGVVLNHNITTTNITDQYRDIENEALNLEIQEERLRDILEKADKVEDLLRIENELSRVRYQINNLRGTLNQYDKLVTMATIDLELEEVKDSTVRLQPVQDGIWGKAKANFVNSVNTIIVIAEKGFIKTFALLPILILMAVIATSAIAIYRLIKKGR